MLDTRRAAIALAAVGKTLCDMTECTDTANFFDCETGACAFNKDGQCRFFAVEQELPTITEEDGCLSGIIDYEYSDTDSD